MYEGISSAQFQRPSSKQRRPTYTPISRYIYYLLRIAVLVRVLNRTDSKSRSSFKSIVGFKDTVKLKFC